MIPLALVRDAAPWVAVWAIGAAIGWEVTSLYYRAEVADIRKEYAERQNKAAQDLADRAIEAQKEQAVLTAQMKVLNDEKQRMQADLDRERADIAAGRRVLYVKATCPAVSADGSTAASGDTGGTARLDAAATADYLDLRRLYNEQLGTLRKCQAFGKAVMARQEKAR